LPSRGSLVVLTGASGSGKTTLAQRILQSFPAACEVFFFDSIGVPSVDVMKTWGDGHQPGGAWQRAMTLMWFERIAPVLATGKSVLFEGQMRIAFIQEALIASNITGATLVLVECDDKVRAERLTAHRQQPELANEQMMGWARYLRDEAEQAHCEILDTGSTPLDECVEILLSYLVRVR
jgi:dephospho-CoA kinase